MRVPDFLTPAPVVETSRNWLDCWAGVGYRLVGSMSLHAFPVGPIYTLPFGLIKPSG
jgi:hypothetical protein